MAALCIIGSGMVSAVGLSAPASCAAIRCAIDNFQETRFIDQAGEWLIGAPVILPEPSSGYAQLVGMASMAIAECLSGLSDEDVHDIPLLLGVAESDRPGRLERLDESLLQAIEERLGQRFHERSCVIPRGRVSAAVALINARRLIEQGCSKVLIAGVDSYLTGATLAAYQERDRLLSSHCDNGFIPGEGAAAILVTAVRASEEPQLLCLGLGFGREKATVESEGLPFRADGLTQAVKAAFDDCGFGFEHIDYRLADLTGEQYYFKEAALALSRTLRVHKERVELWSPADCIGECGAMTGPALLCIALAASRKGYGHSAQVLCHSSNDGGERAAMVLGYQHVRAN
ncbi:3-oxoacyl-ACP synthase [Pseudomonas chlororaphis]|uniref:3-oxoacyl-ACP synthase n=1 Tax=Pseudomonas chlororaphis TaxID=587753 RepID=UPI000789EC96|nr:3-oxoacyl-ACP synthase [Pseudomonas chlororaphis]AMS12831.1 3-oxoacyl-ACP synthase [Pseudomonas chlororaphis]